MSKEDVFVMILIASIMFNIGEMIDRNWFYRDRLIENFIKRSKEKGKCLVCERPLKIISEDEP